MNSAKLLSILVLAAILVVSVTVPFERNLYLISLKITVVAILGVIFSLTIKLTRKLEWQKAESEKASGISRYLANEKTTIEEILHGIQDGILTVNLSGFVVSANRKALEILNTAEVTIKNQHISQVIPDKRLAQNLSQELEFPSVSYDGKKLIVKLTPLPLRSWDEKVKGLIYILRDITQEKQLSEMKLDFVAIAAHQLRTPLTVVKSYLAVLSETIYPKLTDEEKLFLDRVKIGAERLVALIENLLTISRIEQGELAIKPTVYDLEKLVGETIDQISDAAKQKNITITFTKLISHPAPVLIDPYLIYAALINLMENAIQFSNSGGSIIVTLQTDQEKAVVHVTDHGKGIPPADAPFIFNKFFKAAHKLSQGSKGSGLGLYIAKSIIDAHHGKIWFNSIEGKGATFSFYLPLTNLPKT